MLTKRDCLVVSKNIDVEQCLTFLEGKEKEKFLGSNSTVLYNVSPLKKKKKDTVNSICLEN